MRHALLLLSAGVAALVACSRESPPAAGSSASATPATFGGQHRSASAVSPAAALDQLDPRAPLPLLPMMAQHQKENMRDHLVAVQEIVAALGSNDFAAVELAARRIGSSEPMQRMCTHMGAGAPGFTEQALAFHQGADRIATAALAHAGDRVLAELASTLAACTSCHASWKQRVVDESTWQRLTASAPPHG